MYKACIHTRSINSTFDTICGFGILKIVGSKLMVRKEPPVDDRLESTLVECMLWLISGGLLRFILSYPNGFEIQIFPGKES